jgi:lysophospholipase L1-like esterase
MSLADLLRRARAPLRVLLHLAVAGLVLEGAARLDDRVRWGAPLLGRYDPEVLRAVDRAGYPRNVPGASFEKWRINHLGFRGPELGPAAPPGAVRIACLGQSESFGLYEGEGGEWPARLQQLLGQRAEVVNASVVGLGRGGRAAYLADRVLPLHPDVVVLYVNVLAELPPLPAPPGPGAAAPGAPRSRFLAKARVALQEALPAGLRRRFRAWRLARELRALEARAPGGRPPADAPTDEAVTAFEAHLRALLAETASAGAIPVLVTYPVLADAPEPARFALELLDERKWHPQWSDRGLVEGTRALNAAVRRVAAERAVPLVDLAEAMPRTRDVFADAVHYTDRGAAVVAERVAAALDRAGLLRPPAAVRPLPARLAPGG